MASYFWENLNASTIPNFLRAGSPQALRRLMLINNKKHKGFVTYTNIQYIESEKKWYAWFVVKVENELELMAGENS